MAGPAIGRLGYHLAAIKPITQLVGRPGCPVKTAVLPLCERPKPLTALDRLVAEARKMLLSVFVKSETPSLRIVKRAKAWW